jgi:hypothetical protein
LSGGREIILREREDARAVNKKIPATPAAACLSDQFFSPFRGGDVFIAAAIPLLALPIAPDWQQMTVTRAAQR